MDVPGEEGMSVRIERVRGRLDESTAAGLRAFWQARDVLAGGQAEARLPKVLARLVDDEGRTVGSSSATPQRVPAVGNQWFQVYRCLIAPPFDTPERWMELLAQSWEILAAEAADASPCIGMLVVLTDPAIARAFPQAIWPKTRFLHAGRAVNGAALRIRYFDGARIGTEGHRA